ncbi:N-acetylmuramoyl-L-alanine amidase family protein [Acetivibrio ethanolgignens]|uniref:MurNAc-LAA domain-containing protein n=1 Tax=Acetivibrio ethanolgignens TaxID=290052 RepID=A0A0V8QD16_9FIRM|nr:N-acetylmuramoyl-L-alanine amidase [Acetivibrio ethanolgignens]KSV58150.1 hypothetical protein ASU35_14020 [Acetivibrio ethanolgignens]
MKEKLLRELAAKSIVIMLGTMVTSYGMGTASVANASFGENVQVDSARVISQEEAKDLGAEKIYTNLETGMVVNQLAEPYLVIEKPESKSYEVSMEDLYMERSLRLSIYGLEDKSFTRGSLSRGNEEDTSIKKVSFVYDYVPEAFSYTAVYEVEFNSLYAYQIYEDKEAIYIELWEPSQLYDRILVVDAGHGGNDIGTYSPDMKYYEKDINLSIVKHLKKLLDKEEIKVYYTRLSDEKVYLNPRIDLANELKTDLLISIHCNSSDSSTAKGCEVLYGTKNQKGLEFDSKALAELCLKSMTENGNLANRGLVKNNEIYIIGKSKVPVALIETGFMSNESDLEFIIKKENQEKMAEYIYQAVMKAFSQLETE